VTDNAQRVDDQEMPMSSTCSMIVESHASASTVYVAGTLTVSSVRELLEAVRLLPDSIRGLRIDLRATRPRDEGVLRALEDGVRQWRAVRHGMSRVMFPDGVACPVVALRFPHTRFPGARPPMRGPTIAPGTHRFRDAREAAVTRSLRERAVSETR
jgi:hypothetical protein